MSVEVRRRGKRRRKARGAGSDRLASAGLAAQAQQDPETQVSFLCLKYLYTRITIGYYHVSQNSLRSKLVIRRFIFR